MTVVPSDPKTLTRIDALARAGFVADSDVADLETVAQRYAVAVPPALAAVIVRGHPVDPVARQVIPSREESVTTPEERADPIGDTRFSPVKGIVHRYPDRVLLKAHSACAVYCRFCFRREVVGPGGESLTPEDVEAALAYIRGNAQIWEVILTGGDPLVMSPARISSLLDALDEIDHVQVVRFHTRLPVAAPERVSDALVAALSKRRVTVYVAVHSNHARELTADAVHACERLTAAGIPLVGQTVLLRDVNDTTDDLESLFRAMVRARITPYYLHHPDLAPGTGHFRVTPEHGQALLRDLRGRVSGLALPAYMLDIPGGYGKVPIGPQYLSPTDDGTYTVEDVNGQRHTYPPR
jgi:lysine 2,3-aminomutase